MAPRPEREKPASGSSDAGSMAMPESDEENKNREQGGGGGGGGCAGSMTVPFRSQILERVTRMPAETGTAPAALRGEEG